MDAVKVGDLIYHKGCVPSDAVDPEVANVDDNDVCANCGLDIVDDSDDDEENDEEKEDDD